MASPPSHSQAVLPDSRSLKLNDIVRTDGRFILYVSTRQAPACPTCGRISKSRHSSYIRRLQDLPWQGRTVEIQLRVGRFRCRYRHCPRKIFTERLPRVARSYSRQTLRLGEIIRLIGYAIGGLPGQRVLERLAVCVSDDTVLRRIKAPSAQSPSPDQIRHLGVDDWAWRKGQDYGTILVDLDRHRVADLLADRNVDAFRSWLEVHPTVTLIARDRCGIYAEAASLAVPHARQVADRFHLLLNLSAAVERAFEERNRQLLLPAPPSNSGHQDAPENVPTTSKPTAQQLLKLQRRERRIALYEKVKELYQQGYSGKAISRALGLERKTVRKYLRAPQFPERKQHTRRPRQVQQFMDHLRSRWLEGCHNATRLFHEIRKLGYRGGRSMVAQFVSGWRRSGRPSGPDAALRIAPKHAAILVTKPADQLTSSQQALLDRLAVECPDSVRIRAVSSEFREVLFSGESRRLLQWIDRTKRCEIRPLVRFAWGLTKDLAAVRAAADTSWSSGQVEGQINRLKMLKRQMYGRAGFMLLRARVLPYAPFIGAPQRAP
ncbi:MAG: ISL3 family transposase [Bryobacteraceae bacterium]|nr:ISL3 family transposase [Bryobacteraceae bacterium]